MTAGCTNLRARFSWIFQPRKMWSRQEYPLVVIFSLMRMNLRVYLSFVRLPQYSSPASPFSLPSSLLRSQIRHISLEVSGPLTMSILVMSSSGPVLWNLLQLSLLGLTLASFDGLTGAILPIFWIVFFILFIGKQYNQDGVGVDQMAKDGPWQTAQVSPLAMRMQPSSPHLGPQLFFMVQQSALEPTRKTAWLMFLAQLEKIPDLQGDQLEASTLTAIGLLTMISSISSQPCPSATPKGRNEPELILHCPSLAVQGQSAEVVCPLSLMYSKARTPYPPLHPWFSQGDTPEQSTSCCSLRSMVLG